MTYNADQAKLNPEALMGSPSIIIQVPNKLAAPKPKHDNLVGFKSTGFLTPACNGALGCVNPLRINDVPNTADGIGEVPRVSTTRYTCFVVGADIVVVCQINFTCYQFPKCKRLYDELFAPIQHQEPVSIEHRKTGRRVLDGKWCVILIPRSRNWSFLTSLTTLMYNEKLLELQNESNR